MEKLYQKRKIKKWHLQISRTVCWELLSFWRMTGIILRAKKYQSEQSEYTKLIIFVINKLYEFKQMRINNLTKQTKVK